MTSTEGPPERRWMPALSSVQFAHRQPVLTGFRRGSSGSSGSSGVAVAAVLAVAAIATCACASAGSGSSGPPSSAPTASAPPTPQALAAVTQAAARTLALTSSVDLSFSRPSSNVPSTTPKSASGTVDFRSPAGAIRIDLPGRYGGIEKMVFLPGTVFIEPPSSNLPLQAGKPWIFANFADIAKYKVNFPPYIVQTESINPAFTLSELAWGLTAAAPVGPSTFRGQQAAGYSVTVDVNRALSHATGPAGDVFAHALSSEISASGGGGSTAPVTLAAEVWVDGSGRLVGVRVTPPGAGVGTLTLALGPFGVSMHTDVPPRAKVVDIAAMIPGGEQEALNGGDTDGA